MMTCSGEWNPIEHDYSHRLWVVARDAIAELDDPDLLKPPFDRSHKRPGGYLIKHKLEAAKARASGARE
jgi:hypothetical protein